jgi:hypothetical protein
MSLAGGKSKRTLRVATVFTGVAAVAVGMAQAANAQDAAQPAAKQTTTLPGRAIGEAVRISGSIRSAWNCHYFGEDPSWLHVSTLADSYGPYMSACFGGKGIMHSPPGSGLFAECGGNNKGYINGNSNGGTIESVGFGPGTTYRKVYMAHYDDVVITGWTGADKCPATPMWNQ